MSTPTPPKPPAQPVQKAASVTQGTTQGAVKPAAPVAPPFQIHALGDYDRWLKMLVYGDYGTGKTRVCGSAVTVPQMCDVLFIDAEAGDLTIATEVDFSKQAFEHLSVVRVKDFKTYARVQEFLKLHCQFRDLNTPEADAQLKTLEQKLFPADQFKPNAPPKRFRTVITDSLSEVETYSMYQLLGVNDRSRIDEELSSPEWNEFKKNHSQVLRAIRAYRDLPMHVLMTCAASYVQDDAKRMIWMPALTGKLARQCQGFMDIVGYMYVSSGENNTKIHSIQVQPTPKINAKCRFSNMKQMGWQNPTMRSILEAVGLLDKGIIKA